MNGENIKGERGYLQIEYPYKRGELPRIEKIYFRKGIKYINNAMLLNMIKKYTSAFSVDDCIEYFENYLTVVVLPNSAEIIEKDAFKNSKNLKSVIAYPNSHLKEIKDNAFLNCESLKHLGLNSCSKLDKIASSAFINTLVG